jgi:hypothetical protein
MIISGKYEEFVKAQKEINKLFASKKWKFSRERITEGDGEDIETFTQVDDEWHDKLRELGMKVIHVRNTNEIIDWVNRIKGICLCDPRLRSKNPAETKYYGECMIIAPDEVASRILVLGL